MPHLKRGSVKISYDVVGAGPAVLMIQGIAVIGNGWKPQVDAMSSHFQFATFDHRGIGASSPVKGTMTIDEMVDDAIAIMDDLNWSSAHIVGHSMGGVIAQQLAVSHPTRVKSLTLMCTVARGANAVKMSLPMLLTAIRMHIGPRRSRRRAFLELLMPRPHLNSVDAEMLATALAPLFGYDLACQPMVAMKQAGALKKQDMSHALADVRVPTLIINAQYDRIAPPHFGRDLHERIAGSRFIEIPDAAHGVPIQKPDLINTLLQEHWISAP